LSRSSSFIASLLFSFFAATAWAIDSQPAFTDPVLQARYEELTHELRCLVCQNETVADSNADLAADFRRQIHDMVAAGKSSAEVREYMVARYGNFILYKPPLETGTWMLWTGPFLLLLIAFTSFVAVVRRRARIETDENRRVER
jgi:cytochrome c-type biogenesis protein CcmH